MLTDRYLCFVGAWMLRWSVSPLKTSSETVLAVTTVMFSLQCLLSSPYQMSSCRRRAATASRCVHERTARERLRQGANTDLRQHPAHDCLTGMCSLTCESCCTQTGSRKPQTAWNLCFYLVLMFYAKTEQCVPDLMWNVSKQQVLSWRLKLGSRGDLRDFLCSEAKTTLVLQRWI